MNQKRWAPIATVSVAVIFAGLLLWGLSGPSAGMIANPVEAQGTVALTDQEGQGRDRRCSVQAIYEVGGKGYGTSQLPYQKTLCKYQLGDSIAVVYDQKKPSRSAALKTITDPPLWPAYLSGALLLLGLLWVAALYKPARGKKPPMQESKNGKGQEELETKNRPAPKAASARTSNPTDKDPAGWYPARGGRLRWWNGSKWTDNYQ